MSRKSLIVKWQRNPKFKVRHYSRCNLCGRPKGYIREFKLCRICFRNLALQGEIPGITKSSW